MGGSLVGFSSLMLAKKYYNNYRAICFFVSASGLKSSILWFINLFQRRIQDPIKHLCCYQLKAVNYFCQSTPLQMYDKVLNMPLCSGNLSKQPFSVCTRKYLNHINPCLHGHFALRVVWWKEMEFEKIFHCYKKLHNFTMLYSRIRKG